VYPHQIERLTAACERDRLAAVVATSRANIFYLTGFESPGPDPSSAERIAVWAPGGEVLTAPAKDAARASDALRELGVTRGRIGLDEGGLTQAAGKRLAARLAAFTVVPAGATLAGARRVKSPYEIECLSRSLGLAEEALNAVLQMLEPGVTERAAAAVYEREVLARDGRPASSRVAFGQSTWIVRPSPTERALKTGDLVRFDVGAVFKGYCSSVARVAVMGEPSARQASVFDAVQAGLDAAIDAVTPGITGAALQRAVVARVSAGLAGFDAERVGHGIGLQCEEPPTLGAGENGALEAGEVVTIDVPYLEAGWGGVVLRDTVLVTTSGSRTVNRSVHGLVVLD
jgi:Xaa-Pro dipeptidase